MGLKVDPGPSSSQTRGFWCSESDWFSRNQLSTLELNTLYEETIGTSRLKLNRQFLGGLPKDVRILEVGAGAGLQLSALAWLGFHHLYGLDLNLSASQLNSWPSVQGNTLALPFSDDSFDLVFTSGTLIHIPPERLPRALAEIVRVSKRWVYGYEYFNTTLIPVKWRDKEGLMWKGPYFELYQDQGLRLAKTRYLPHIEDETLVDQVFLLEKGSKC